MPTTAKKQKQKYLLDARLQAGYANRDEAAGIIPFAPQTIGRHERGESQISPDDAILYATIYRREDILYRYCSECLIGQATGKCVKDRSLPQATIRLMRLLRLVAKDSVEALENLAYDEVIDDSKWSLFEKTVIELKNLNETISDYLLCAAKIHKIAG